MHLPSNTSHTSFTENLVTGEILEGRIFVYGSN